MPEIKHETRTVTRVEHTVTVTKADLLEWLRRKESMSRAAVERAGATITVPSGGDYSGDTLDLDDVGGITVTWTEESVE